MTIDAVKDGIHLRRMDVPGVSLLEQVYSKNTHVLVCDDKS